MKRRRKRRRKRGKIFGEGKYFLEEKKNYEVREGKYLEKLTIFIWRRRKQRRKKIGERKQIFFEKKNGEGKYLEMEKVKGKQKGGKYHGEGKIVANEWTDGQELKAV